MTTPLKTFADRLRDTEGLVLVVTGAGMSLASGIPTFRGTDPGAVWKRDVTELGTNQYFLEEPEGSWRWYLSRFEKVFGAKPNAGHQALVELEQLRARQQRPFLLITQNIDGLHLDAGSKELVEVHGTSRRVRCSEDGCVNGAPRGSLPIEKVDFTAFRREPTRENVPRCPACGALVRAHVLWFDEMYDGHQAYQWGRVQEAAFEAELVLFVGTSFSVGVTELIAQAAMRRRVPIFNLDPAGQPMRGVTLVAEASETALPALVRELHNARDGN